MMSSIQQALETHLNTLSPKPRIAWPNVVFTPVATELYIEPKVVPTFLDDESIDRVGSMRQNALFIVDVYSPKGSATFDSNQMLSRLEAHFPRDLVLTTATAKIRIKTRSRNTPSIAGEWFVQGLNINVYSINT